jgi:hypothetical protein
MLQAKVRLDTEELKLTSVMTSKRRYTVVLNEFTMVKYNGKESSNKYSVATAKEASVPSTKCFEQK